MEQHEQSQGKQDTSKELLNVALEAGNPDLIEFQLAKWQLANRPRFTSEQPIESLK